MDFKRDMKFKPTPWVIIKTAFYYFAFGRPEKTFIIGIILVTTLAKNIISGVSRFLFDRFETSNEPFSSILLKILIFKSATIVLNFITDFIFEKTLIPYGGVLSKIILTNMLYSDGYETSGISGTQTEYYITEGSKSLAKINRLVILGVFSKTIHLFLDLGFIYYKDRSSGKLIFGVVVVGTILISMFKVRQVRATLPHLELNNDFSFQREKQYSETMDAIHVVKSYRYEESSVDKYKRKSKLWEYTWINYKYLVFYNDLVYSSLGAMFRIGTVILYVYFHKSSGVNDMTMVLNVTTDILKSGTNIVKLHKDIFESLALSTKVFEYILIAREDLQRKVRIDMFNESIEVRNLTYSARGKVIFSDVNFILNRGDKAALIGRNGVGKSSIFKLLMNFDEYQGEIFMDGIDITRIAMIDYRSLITFVPQDTRLFDESIYANLCFGNNRSYSDIVAECIRMKIHDKIMMLSNGYNTVVGEFGKNINGGLRQKIFYTRAFLRDTPIYLFDEPTNNLDDEASEFILEYINDPAYSSKTFLIVCHDQELVKEFPKIFKFENNKIHLTKLK
ncbi:hypothetical protein PAEPH01_1699 [Pancytospora epiphaga]|nr:hypothetical protein PAEPH01_1699 [Pancytospora epiphaga]